MEGGQGTCSLVAVSCEVGCVGLMNPELWLES